MRSNITSYIKCLNNEGYDVDEGKLTGNKIKALLQLKTSTRLNNHLHKKFFYILKSSHLDNIQDVYKIPQQMHPNNVAQTKWIVSFAHNLKNLKNNQCPNSLENIPEGTKPLTMFFLWK